MNKDNYWTDYWTHEDEAELIRLEQLARDTFIDASDFIIEDWLDWRDVHKYHYLKKKALEKPSIETYYENLEKKFYE